MSGNTEITDFERQVQDRALEARNQSDENPGILQQISNKSSELADNFNSQNIRESVNDVLHGKHSSHQGAGTLEAGKSQPVCILL